MTLKKHITFNASSDVYKLKINARIIGGNLYVSSFLRIFLFANVLLYNLVIYRMHNKDVMRLFDYFFFNIFLKICKWRSRPRDTGGCEYPDMGSVN